MKSFCGSGDESVLAELRGRIAAECGHFAPSRQVELVSIVERAVRVGTPFRDLDAETSLHSVAASLLADHRQELLVTGASVYNALALEQGLWPLARKLGTPEVKAFFRGLVEGIPLFGRQLPTDGSAYAVIPLDSLRVFLPHIRDLAEVIEFRVSRKRAPTDDDRYDVTFSAEFRGWVEEIANAERDLWFCFG